MGLPHLRGVTASHEPFGAVGHLCPTPVPERRRCRATDDRVHRFAFPHGRPDQLRDVVGDLPRVATRLVGRDDLLATRRNVERHSGDSLRQNSIGIVARNIVTEILRPASRAASDLLDCEAPHLGTQREEEVVSLFPERDLTDNFVRIVRRDQELVRRPQRVNERCIGAEDPSGIVEPGTLRKCCRAGRPPLPSPALAMPLVPERLHSQNQPVGVKPGIEPTGGIRNNDAASARDVKKSASDEHGIARFDSLAQLGLFRSNVTELTREDPAGVEEGLAQPCRKRTVFRRVGVVRVQEREHRRTLRSRTRVRHWRRRNRHRVQSRERDDVGGRQWRRSADLRESASLAAGDKPYLTTREAAVYCGFRSSSGLRKAHHDRRVFPVGRRGGTGPCVWAVEDLDRFLRGERPLGSAAERSGAPSEGRPDDEAEQGRVEVDQGVRSLEKARVARSVAPEGRRASRTRTSEGGHDRKAEGDLQGDAGRRRGDGVEVAHGRKGARSRRGGPQLRVGSSASPNSPRSSSSTR